MQLFLNPRFRLYVGAILISFSPIFVSLVDVSPTVSAFYRVFIGGVVLILFSLLKKQELQFNKVIWLFLIISAFFFRCRFMVLAQKCDLFGFWFGDIIS